MQRTTTLLTILAAGCGAALGYAAATGKLRPRRAALAESEADSADKAPADKLDRTVLPIAEPTYNTPPKDPLTFGRSSWTP